MIQLQNQTSPVIEKTRELCQVLLEQETFQKMKQDIDAFASDEEARALYEELCDLQDMLQAKDGQGATISEEEMKTFEEKREALFANPVASGFIDAQQHLHKLQETVAQYISKTFKLGRIPEENDFEKGSCGPSCGCSGGQ